MGFKSEVVSALINLVAMHKQERAKPVGSYGFIQSDWDSANDLSRTSSHLLEQMRKFLADGQVSLVFAHLDTGLTAKVAGYDIDGVDDGREVDLPEPVGVVSGGLKSHKSGGGFWRWILAVDCGVDGATNRQGPREGPWLQIDWVWSRDSEWILTVVFNRYAGLTALTITRKPSAHAGPEILQRRLLVQRCLIRIFNSLVQ